MNIEKELGIFQIELPTPFPVGPVNVFLIKEDPPILVDTGLNSDETYEALTSALAEHGVAFSDLGAIILTHGHRDHMGLLGHILRGTDVDSYGHPLVQRLGREVNKDPEDRKQFFLGILDEFGVPSEIKEGANSLYDRFRAFSEPYELKYTLEDGDQALGYTVYHVPGHSPSDTLFVNTEKRYTIAGDHILAGTNPNPLLRRPDPGQPRAKSLVEYQQSLRRSRDLDLGLCLPGHGEPFSNHVEVVDNILERQQRRSEIVLKLVKEGRHTPYSVSKKLFPKLPEQHLHLGLSIAVGHMEVLEEQGELTGEIESRILTFRPA